MARLWEDTLVIALRDAQWIRAHNRYNGQEHPYPCYPQNFVKLDGNAERDMGDILYEEDVRFFIFEVKPTRDEIKDEWVRRGQYKPKWAYRTLKALCEQWLDRGADLRHKDAVAEEMQRSIRSHHFVWWSDQQTQDGIHNNIRFQPYIDTAIQMRSVHGPTQSDAFPYHPHGFMVGRKNNNALTLVRSASFKLIYDDHGCVAAMGRTPKPQSAIGAYWAAPLGLPKDEFQKYVNYLCEQSSGHDEPIHAIVLSSCGRFMKVARRTSQLSDIFSPSPTETYQVNTTPPVKASVGDQYAPIGGAPRPRNKRNAVK